MNTRIIKTDSTVDKLNKSAVLDESIYKECSYGLEYVLDEISPQVEGNVCTQLSMEWAGLDDLII